MPGCCLPSDAYCLNGLRSYSHDASEGTAGMNSDEQCEGMIMQAEETLSAAEEGVKSGRRASLKIGQQKITGDNSAEGTG